MKAAEIRALPENELLAKVQEIRAKLFQMKFKATTEPVTDPAEVRDLKKDVARIHTILTERKLKGAPKTGHRPRETRKTDRAKLALAKSITAKKAAIKAERTRLRQPKQAKKPAAKAGAKKG